MERYRQHSDASISQEINGIQWLEWSSDSTVSNEEEEEAREEKEEEVEEDDEEMDDNNQELYQDDLEATFSLECPSIMSFIIQDLNLPAHQYYKKLVAKGKVGLESHSDDD
ncbi:hypothetical protein PVK06_007347 [Gossypium arboreum]|uniref:Uncharacterized protein n=1 Tax=Gossypium arboreum TaxID=29729 RepID=A0ABR0QIG8_GOSAR|nr:hypothetical protein PVK06_007347 [Gossypium arboreum]